MRISHLSTAVLMVYLSWLLKVRAFVADYGPHNSNCCWIEWVMKLKCDVCPRSHWLHPTVYSSRFAALTIRGPCILQRMRLMLSQPRSLIVSHNLVLRSRVKTVYPHLLRLLALIFNREIKNHYIFHMLFSETALTHWGLMTQIWADYPCQSLYRYVCR